MKHLAAILLLVMGLAACQAPKVTPPPQPTQEQGAKILREWWMDWNAVGGLPRRPLASVPFQQPLLLPIRWQGVDCYQNFEDWTVTVRGIDYRVPAGLVVDGASVPRACWPFMPPDGLHRGAALFHDYCYILRGQMPDGTVFTRKEADVAFYHLMLEAGVSERRAGLAYRGVRFGGWAAWASRESPLILPVERQRMMAPQFLPPRGPHSHLYAP